MSFLANGTENNARIGDGVGGKAKNKEMPCPEPNPSEKLNWLIHLQHVRGETGACKELIKSEIKRSSGKNEFAYFKQGAIFREECRIQEALESFQTCMKLNSSNPENVKEVAKCLYEMRRFRLALEAYLEAERVSKSPDWQISYSIGQCLMRLGEVSKAKDYAQRAVQLGKHEIAFSLLIKILTVENDLQGAIAVCSAAVEACPDSVDMLTESGLLHLKMGQTQLAFERLSSALALDPLCTEALLGIGCIIQSHEEHDVALTKYKLAVSNKMDSVALWNNIGMCFHAKQKHVAAISCLKRALWISPLNWRLLFNLGLVHLATYQPASAFNFLCASVNLRPDIAHSFTVLGCALMELKDTENASRAFKQALSLAPEDPVVIMNNVLCSAVIGRKEQALACLENFKRLREQNAVTSKEAIVMADCLSSLLEISAPIQAVSQQELMHSNSSIKNEENANETKVIGDDLPPTEMEPDEV